MNVFVNIGSGVEVAAKDFLDFCDDLKLEVRAIISPRALIALAVLASAMEPVVLDATAAASVDGLNIPLDLETTQLIISTWPDLKAYLNALAIKPVPWSKK